MREIKFRAWDKESKHMCRVTAWYDDLVQVELADQMIELGRDECELMQFTGLLDKNGKEIYEGDLLRWDFSAELLEVRWGNVGWVLFSTLFAQFGRPDGADCGETNTRGYTSKSEVVGNIYESPELLTP